VSKDNEIDREALLRVANHVRPAVAAQPYIPALTHIFFDGSHALASNDVAAISVRCDIHVGRLLPGDLLIRALSSFAGDSVLLQPDAGALVLSSGRSKVKLPVLPLEDYPFEMPTDDGHTIELGASSVEAIKRCLFAVGTDAKRPEQMGVTMEEDGGCAVFYSTDNFTMTRAQAQDEVKMPGGSPVILPTFFCEQVVRLSAAFKETEVDLVVYPGGLLAEIGRHAKVFSKTLVDMEPLNFPAVFKKMVGSEKDLSAALGKIPDGMDAALDRAVMVLGGDRSGTKLSPGDGAFAMASEGPMGAADDRLRFDGRTDAEPRSVDPSLLARGAKVCTRMAFMPRCMALSDDSGSFVHLVSIL
jgi:DNA polymerase-3 subunit beta